MFTDNIETITSNVVATIGGKYLIPKDIGTVSWYFTDDEVKLHTNKLKNVLYFTDSPVNTLIATVINESIKDDEVIWVLTRIIFPSLLRFLVNKQIQ